MNEQPSVTSRGRLAGAALALVGAPYILAWLPFLFHRSDEPVFMGYGRSYLAFLSAGLAFIAAVAVQAARSARRSGTLNAAFGWVLWLGTLLLFGGVGEFVLRIRHQRFMDPFWGQRPSLFLGYENRPFHSWTNSYGAYRTDQAGFRFREHDPEWRARRSYRIMALGESSTFGLGLAETNTWTFLLERELRRAPGADRVDVVNAGNPGHNSLQIYLQFLFKVYPERPDMVILYLGKNDAVVPSAHSPTRLEIDPSKLMSYSKLDYVARMYEGKCWYARTLAAEFVRERLKAWAQRAGAARAPADPASAGPGPGAEGTPDYLVNNGRDFFLKHVAAIADGCRRLGADLVLVTFAHVLEGWPGQAVGYYNQLLREFAEGEGCVLVDFERLIADEQDPASFFWDDHHPNEEGARRLAGALSLALEDRVRAACEGEAAVGAPLSR